MQLRILGSLEVTDDLGATVVVAGIRRRALLVRLLIDANRVLSVERLIADLWEGDPPPAAPVTLQSHISHVRKLVGAGKVFNRSGGYLFSLGDSQLDVIDFEADLAAGRQLLRDGRPQEAVVVLGRAIAHWRGPALADVAEAEWSRPEVVRLEEMRLDAVELGLEARLAAGQSAEVVALAEAAVAEHPFRENVWAHLIAALYRQGRQADALEAFQRLRRCLVEGLGLEPSARLVELDQAVLLHRPALDAPAPPTVPAPAVLTVPAPAVLTVPAPAVPTVPAPAPLSGPAPVSVPPKASDPAWESDADVNGVLATAAILGMTFTVPFLAEVADIGEPAIRDALDAARKGGVVADAGQDRFDFVDSVVHRAYYDHAGPTGRAIVHRRAARLLNGGRSGSTPAATMEEVRHWLAGGRVGDLQVIIPCLRRGVEHALRHLGTDGAARWLAEMVAIVDAERGPDDPARPALLVACGEAFRMPGAADDGDPTDHPTLLLEGLLTSNRRLVGPAAAAPELLAVACLAMARLAKQDRAGGAWRLAKLANDLTWTNPLEDRLLVGRQAVELAGEPGEPGEAGGGGGDPSLLVTVVALIYPAVAVPSTHAWRLELTAEAIAAAARSGRPMMRFVAAFVRLQCVIEAGDRQEADLLVDRLDQIAAEQEEALYAWVATLCRGWRQLIDGDLPSAGDSIAAFRELGTRLAQPETAVACYKLRIAIARHEGTPDPANLDGRTWSSSLLPLDRPQCLAAVQALDEGNYGESIHLLQAEAKRRFSTRSTPDWLPTQLGWADVALRLRAAGPALQLYEQLLPYASHLQMGPLTAAEGAVAEYLGALAGLLGRFEDADRHYREATTLLREFGAPFHLARAQLAWARLLGGQREPGRADRARSLLIDTIAVASRYGCDGVDRAARQELLANTLRQEAFATAGR